jgi:hypothetical protein
VIPRRGTLIVLALLFVGIAGYYFGYWRALAALAMSSAILWLGFSYFRSAGESPPDAEPEDVTTSDLAYVCSVCGLELKVEVATTDRAPTHCREKMDLIDRAAPPLRPV